MITIKVIALGWTVLMSMFQLVAKVSGIGVLGTMIIKLFYKYTTISFKSQQAYKNNAI